MSWKECHLHFIGPLFFPQPAYQNLRQRVEGSLNRFLAKENQRWHPNMNKNQLRNQLRKYIQE